MPRPKKKVILFVLEGHSDRAALERPIQTMLQEKESAIEAAFLEARTDVTSYYKNHPGNIMQAINKWHFDPFFSAHEYYYPKDIMEVVQISDLDGTFIPPSFCLPYDETHWDKDLHFVYDPPHIFADDPKRITDRNTRKAENLRFLLRQPTIKVRSKTVPYSVYYFSSNIDHFLHNRLGLSQKDKNDLAAAFADSCVERPDYFRRTMCAGPCTSQGMDYWASWDYVMEGTNSLMRFTNFNIYLNSLEAKIQAEI